MTSFHRRSDSRAERIAAFRQEIVDLELEGVLKLTPEQSAQVEEYHRSYLGSSQSPSVGGDRKSVARRLTWGHRIATMLGGVALATALVLFLLRIWGSLPAAVHASIVLSAPILTLVAAESTHRAGASRFYTLLLVLAANAAFITGSSVLGGIFNIAPTPQALLAWGAFALATGFAYRLRLPFAAGVLLLSSFAAALIVSANGLFWISFLERPESLLPPALIFYVLPRTSKRMDASPFGVVSALCGGATVLLALLILALVGRSSFLDFAPEIVEKSAQLAGLAISAGIVVDGIRSARRALVNLGSIAFLIFLYVKLHSWWWDWMPRYLFFLAVGLVILSLLFVLRRLHVRMSEEGP